MLDILLSPFTHDKTHKLVKSARDAHITYYSFIYFFENLTATRITITYIKLLYMLLLRVSKLYIINNSFCVLGTWLSTIMNRINLCIHVISMIIYYTCLI